MVHIIFACGVLITYPKLPVSMAQAHRRHMPVAAVHHRVHQECSPASEPMAGVHFQGANVTAPGNR